MLLTSYVYKKKMKKALWGITSFFNIRGYVHYGAV